MHHRRFKSEKGNTANLYLYICPVIQKKNLHVLDDDLLGGKNIKSQSKAAI